MKLIKSTRTLDIPEGVTVEVKARHVRVTGPRGRRFALAAGEMGAGYGAAVPPIGSVMVQIYKNTKVEALKAHRSLLEALSCNVVPADWFWGQHDASLTPGSWKILCMGRFWSPKELR
jgi:hypothetical protein